MNESTDRIEFCVETNIGRLIRVVVINRTIYTKDLLLPGERIDAGMVQDTFKIEIWRRANDKKKT